MPKCPRCGNEYEILPQVSDWFVGECEQCGLTARVAATTLMISKYSPEDTLHYEMTKKAEMENAN